MPVFRPEEERAVRRHLEALERPVELALVLGPEESLPGAPDVDFGARARELLEDVAALSDLVTVSVREQPALGAELFPAIAVLPEGEDVGLRYFGLPWGYELTTIVGACVEAGRSGTRLGSATVAALEGLDRDFSVDVFVTPT